MIARVCMFTSFKLTVALLTGVDVSLQRFSLGELGQHFRQMARSLSSRLPAITVIPLWELQRQIPERLHGVGAVVAGQARHLRMTEGKCSGKLYM